MKTPGKRPAIKNTIGGYRNYLTNYIKYADEARMRIKELSVIEQEAELWQSAISENKIEALKKYCDTYPHGRFLDEAKAKIAELIILDQEERDWDRVNQESIFSLNEYLKNYPKGKYLSEANHKINLINEKEKIRREGDQGEITKWKTSKKKYILFGVGILLIISSIWFLSKSPENPQRKTSSNYEDSATKVYRDSVYGKEIIKDNTRLNYTKKVSL